MGRGRIAMTLSIDTSDEVAKLKLIGREKKAHSFANKNLSESLVFEIKKFLKKEKIKFKDIDKIEVKTDNGFSRTRTTVATANALIYALNLNQKFFEPKYTKQPNITLPKHDRH